MAEPIVWGLLPKAQDDPTTIDEAIAAAVVAHLADPEAHTDTGASLDLHRTNETIDHPAGSLPADKISATNIFAQTDFASLDAFSVAGSCTIIWPGVQMRTTSSTNSVAEIESDSAFEPYQINFANFPLLQFVGKFASFASVLSHVVYGQYADDDTDLNIGFEVSSSAMQGIVKVGDTKYSVALSAADTSAHIYRAYVDPVSHDAVFMADGTVLGTIAAVSYYADAVAFGSVPGFFDARVKTLTAAVKELDLASLIIGTTP